MSLHHSLKPVYVTPPSGPEPSSWRNRFPNTADFNFNYHRLLTTTASEGIGRAGQPALKIAVVGAGAAGLLAARELFRCGFQNIDIYEATERIGGRLWTQKVPGQERTTYEMGAMRMPFFPEPGAGGSVIDYFTTLFATETSDFPNPGAADTGIWVNHGKGPDPEKVAEPGEPELIIWRRDQDYPPNDYLVKIIEQWEHLQSYFINSDERPSVVQAAYDSDAQTWERMWREIITEYDAMNFRELAYEPVLRPEHYPLDGRIGYFGGLGLSDEQVQTLYTIGVGDGSWGAFYDISALYIIRTMLFGYGTNLQLIGEAAALPPVEDPLDSLGHPLATPRYLGLQSYPEGFLYGPALSSGESLYDAIRRGADHGGVRLLTHTPVEAISSKGPGKGFTISSPRPGHSELTREDYDLVIATPTTWSLQTEANADILPFDIIPLATVQAIRGSHFITSSKIFCPLHTPFWGEGKAIPQVLISDTYILNMYGIPGGEADPGAVLLSYTWEDDSNKVEQWTNEELRDRCLAEIDRILAQAHNIDDKLSNYVDLGREPAVTHWEHQRYYRGCAKLYRERSQHLNQALLTYNQDHAGRTGLYFAGAAYSVEGGWTEPAFRAALDAVIHIVNNTGGSFNGPFEFSDYPKYSHWSPAGPEERQLRGRYTMGGPTS